MIPTTRNPFSNQFPQPISNKSGKDGYTKPNNPKVTYYKPSGYSYMNYDPVNYTPATNIKKPSIKNGYQPTIEKTTITNRPDVKIIRTQVYKNVGSRGTQPLSKNIMSSYIPTFQTTKGFIQPKYIEPPKVIQRKTNQPPVYKKYAKGYHGIIKKPTYMLVGEAGPEDVDVTPLKKFTPKGKVPKFNTKNQNYPKLNLDKSSYTPKRSKVNIVKKLPKTNIQYPKMTDIFDVKSSQMKMPKGGGYSMGKSKGNDFGMSMPKSENMFSGIMNDSMFGGSGKKQKGNGGIFSMPKANKDGFNFSVMQNIFGVHDKTFDSTSKKANKFYGKVKGKKLDKIGDFGDWGKLDDWTSGFKLGY